MIVFERNYPVNVFDTDLTGRLSLFGLFNYFQDIAGRHATVLGFGREQLMTSGYFWVLSRIIVRIDKMPLTWEEVTIRTWPRGTEGLFALRDIEMRDISGQILAAASTSWLVVDYNSRKVQRPDNALSHLNASFPDDSALGTNAARIGQVTDKDAGQFSVTAGIEDIDVNHHVNNARYIQWVVNSLEPGFISSHIPETVEVNYLSEGHLNDRVTIFSTGSDGDHGSSVHSLRRAADGAELCRIRMKWKNDSV